MSVHFKGFCVDFSLARGTPFFTVYLGEGYCVCFLDVLSMFKVSNKLGQGNSLGFTSSINICYICYNETHVLVLQIFAEPL